MKRMRAPFPIALLGVLLPFGVAAQDEPGSLGFVQNAAGDYDYGVQVALPDEFGSGEFTLELWIRPDDSFPVGPVGGGSDQRNNWSNVDNSPYSSSTWWFAGNFLLDGHNNNGSANGTFSLQFYGGGRLRWLFGDGSEPTAGGNWSVGAYPADTTPSLLDGDWHQVTLVRRFAGSSESTLELWIDGNLVAMQATPVRADMRQWWDGWSGFPPNQEGWFWGAEKQAAIGVLSQYEDYKGLIDELRFWSRAKSAAEISAGFADAVADDAPGLVGRFAFGEGLGDMACDALNAACIDLVNVDASAWSTQNAPITGSDTLPPSIPGNLQGTAVSASRIDLTWNPSSDDVGVAGYDVRRDGIVIETVSQTSFDDTGLSANTSYTYTVSARDAASNESGQSAAVTVTTLDGGGDTTPPTSPSGLASTAVTDTRIDLAWNAASDNVGVTDYDVRRDGIVVASTAQQTSYSDTGLTPDSSYSYTVSARDAAGNTSPESAAVTVMTQAGPDDTAPTTPANLVGNAVSTSRVDLTWSASTDDVGVAGYDIRRNGNVVATTSDTGYSDTGLAASTRYEYTVAARDAAGNTSDESALISVVTDDASPPPGDGGSSGGGGSFGIPALIALLVLRRRRR